MHDKKPIGLASCLVCLCLITVGARADEPAPRQVDFFESRIRPVLVEHCYECHNSIDANEGGLAVDHRAAMLKGGDGGAIVVAGKPAESRLLAILRHDVDGLEMPQDGPKLDARVVADFEQWIAAGAVDPRDQPPTADELAAATSWDAVLQRRKQWWSFRPIQFPPPPSEDPRTGPHPIDRFIAVRRRTAGLEPAAPAEPAVLVRRLYFNLIGLPPDRQQAERWTTRIEQATPAQRDAVVGTLVDELIESPRFGERWARHWMDWIRYAESHGSEGDPEIAQAWIYRDYLIRALNADVPCDQLLREHVAGDLLPQPRINKALGINESAIGPAHWRMVFHGFAPTDALDEKVRFTDDQINAFSKAFLGLTVSCARCHDHKFDAISQADYYALFGVLGSCRPARTVIDLPERVNLHRTELAALKPKIRAAVAQDWLAAANDLGVRIAADDGPWKQAEKADALLHPLFVLRTETSGGADFEAAWRRRVEAFEKNLAQQHEQQSRSYPRHWNLAAEEDYAEWFAHGAGLPERPFAAGEFAVAATGDRALTGIYPAGVYSHSISAKHPARLTSDDLIVSEDAELWVRVRGDSGAALRYVVQDYPRNGTVYPVTKLSDSWRWQRYDLSYWKGDKIHLELTAAADAPLLVGNQPRSWFGIREALLQRKGQPAPIEAAEFLAPLFVAARENRPTSLDELVELYVTAVTAAVDAWQDGAASDEQALLLDACLRQELLPNRLEALPAARPLIDQYRQLENEIPVPTRVPGLDEKRAQNQRLFERGNHKLPGAEVPRRFLEAIDATPYQTQSSGRRELAEDLLRDDNPLTRRVIVNRVWHHLFGRGIVSTPDNFGRLGDQPSHPELLDWLASTFAAEGWSLRKLIRLIVTSRSWQLSSHASANARELDPENRLLSHANVRRLEAEAIRDLLLTVSGGIEHRLGGAPVAGNAPRRSVYVRVRRNSLDPFLRAFDFPEPFSAVGRRDVTNVPAQSLTMMNEPRVSAYATGWARGVLGDESLTTSARRIGEMFLTAFGRPPTSTEIKRVEDFLAASRQRMEERQRRLTEVQHQLAARRGQVQEITAPVRKRLLAAAERDPKKQNDNLPQPIARWDFDQTPDGESGVVDTIGAADGELKAAAAVTDGALTVRRGGHVVTKPLQSTLRAKTLEAWVQLDNLDQRGGGVMTIQTRNGVIFDSIVFGERDPRRWLAGSNNFARTQPFGGPAEESAVKQPVHVAIAYHEDGRIVGYRNGVPYGKPFQSNGPQEFKAGQSVISFGLRHLPAGGNRLLSGRLLKAQLYDRALSAAEIAATSGASAGYVSQGRVLAELSADDRATVGRLTTEIEMLQGKVREFGPALPAISEVTLWTELARAMFTFKELIYVR